MELKQAFDQVMNESIHMALATSVDNQPNVRVVTFASDEAQEGKLYFSTFKGCNKIEEFAKNSQVTCMPLPMGPESACQVRVFGKVQKSPLSLQKLVELIGKKSPDDAGTIMDGGDMIEVYEVCFTEAMITVGMSPAQRYAID